MIPNTDYIFAQKDEHLYLLLLAQQANVAII